MKNAYITLYGSKFKIKTRIPANFVKELNKTDRFIQIPKNGNQCIIPKDKILEINFVNPKKNVKK